MIDRIDSELHFHRTALGLRTFRQELLASNIANADTPHFKARDIDFKSALEGALSGKTGDALGLNRTSTRHIGAQPSGLYGDAVKYRAEYQGAVDGNTVNMDIERGAFAENALHVEAMLTFINGRFRSLASAIQGQ